MRYLLLTILTAFCTYLYSQDKINVRMNRIIDSSNSTMTHTLGVPAGSWSKIYPKVDYSNIKIDSAVNLYNSVKYNQTIFQAYKRGDVAKSFVDNQINKWGMDTLVLGNETINSYLVATMGEIDGDKCIIIDKNGDGSLNNDPVLFHVEGLGKHTIKYEMYESGGVVQDSLVIDIQDIDYDSKIVTYKIVEFREGGFSYENSPYTIKLTALLNDYRFNDHEVIEIFRGDEGLGKYGMNDVIPLGENQYKILPFDDRADNIQLAKYVEDQVVSTQVGAYAPIFEGKDQFNKIVNLEDFRGSNVILYFWNSTCSASTLVLVDNLKPYLQQNPSVKLLSVALDDRGNFKNYDGLGSKSESLIIQPANGAINDIYQVSLFPTIYLVNKEGKIVLKEDRGINLQDIMRKIEKSFKAE